MLEGPTSQVAICLLQKKKKNKKRAVTFYLEAVAEKQEEWKLVEGYFQILRELTTQFLG